MKSLIQAILSFFKAVFGKKKPTPVTPPVPVEPPETIVERLRTANDDYIAAVIKVQHTVKNMPPLDPMLALWERCMRHMARYGYVIDTEMGGGNIIFVSGYGLDGKPNDNKHNKWNDLCFVARNTPAGWAIPFVAECTTSPGTAPSLAKTALERGGIARIVPGQYFAWKRGYHKQIRHGTSHPAFVQCKVVSYTRDLNQDMSTTGDRAYSGVIGVNIHAQADGVNRDDVNFNSEGCLVLRLFEMLQKLRKLVEDFNSFKKSGEETIFAATIIEGNTLPDLIS